VQPGNSLAKNAKQLRNNATDAERLLWRYLRNSQLDNIKFRRQQPVENYIVDFASFHPKLIIELDGSQHTENHLYDQQRDTCLRKNGFTVLRFWNNDIFENIEGVLEQIRLGCHELASPTPQPPPARGGGELTLDP
jgi:very-short-patch-repair endonuclease